MSTVKKELFKAPVPGDPAKQLMRLMDPQEGLHSGFERVREAYLYRLYNRTVEHVRSKGNPDHQQVEIAEIPDDIIEAEQKALKAAEEMGAGEILKNLQDGKYQMMNVGPQHMPQVPPSSINPSQATVVRSNNPSLKTIDDNLSLYPTVTEHDYQELSTMGMDLYTREEIKAAEEKIKKRKNVFDMAKALGALPGKALQRAKAEGSVLIQGKAPERTIEHRITCCTGIKEDGTVVSTPCPYLDSSEVPEGVRDGHCEACGCPKDRTTRIARKATMPAYACPKKHWSKVQGVRIIKDDNVQTTVTSRETTNSD